MNSPHLVTSTNVHQFNSNNSNKNNIFNDQQRHSAHLTNTMHNNNNNNNNNNNHNTPTSSSIPLVSSSPTQTSSNTNKIAPARRLAARQTLRLAIPKQQGDTFAINNNNTGSSNLNNYSTNLNSIYKNSPSQLPPAPILKRPTSALAVTPSNIPKTASPLESHTLPNVIQHLSPASASSSVMQHNGSLTATPTPGTNKFLGLRKPSITLNSTDLRNNNDLFAFAKDMSPAVDMRDHSPIFADISSSLSPSNSSGTPSPKHQISRLFSLSPSSMRNYGNLTTNAIKKFLRKRYD